MNKVIVLLVLLGAVPGMIAKLTQREERALGRFTHYWLESKNVAPGQCSSFHIKAASNSYDYVAPMAQSHYPELNKLYGQIIKRIIRQCNQRFHDASREILYECNPESDCGKATANYTITAKWTKRDGISLAVRIAGILAKNLGPGASVDTFEDEFRHRGPCRPVVELLDRDHMAHYAKYFFTLISNSEYYPSFDTINQKAADVIAACRHLQSTDGLLERAYDVYSIISVDSIDMNLQKLDDLLFSLDVEGSPVSTTSDQENRSNVTEEMFDLELSD